MESLGEQLKKARETKNFSLEEIASATKINIKLIEALENDRYDSSPLPPVYIKGFIRSYCRYVGLDEKEILRLYKEAPDSNKTDDPYKKEELRKPSHRKRVLVLVLLLMGLIGVLAHTGFISFLAKEISVTKSNKVLEKAKGEETPPPKKGALSEESVSPEEIQALPQEELPKEDVPSGEQIPPPLPIPVKMKVESQLDTWVEIKIDNNPSLEMMLFRGNMGSWEAKEKIELKVGNAGGIKINVNDIPLKPFGKIGEVVTLVFQGTTFSLNGGEVQNLETWQDKEEASLIHEVTA